jgi:hypothetical protein
MSHSEAESETEGSLSKTSHFAISHIAGYYTMMLTEHMSDRQLKNEAETVRMLLGPHASEV